MKHKVNYTAVTKITLNDGTIHYTDNKVRFCSTMEGKGNEGSWVIIVNQLGTQCFRCENIANFESIVTVG